MPVPIAKLSKQRIQAMQQGPEWRMCPKSHKGLPPCPTCQHCSSYIYQMSHAGLNLSLGAGIWTHNRQYASLELHGSCVCVIVCRLPDRICLQAQTVILINCGAQADLWNILQLQPGSGTRIIVADSHRWALLPKATHLYGVIPKPGAAA